MQISYTVTSIYTDQDVKKPFSPWKEEETQCDAAHVRITLELDINFPKIPRDKGAEFRDDVQVHILKTDVSTLAFKTDFSTLTLQLTFRY